MEKKHMDRASLPRPEAVPILCKVYEKVDGENLYSHWSGDFFDQFWSDFRNLEIWVESVESVIFLGTLRLTFPVSNDGKDLCCNMGISATWVITMGSNNQR